MGYELHSLASLPVNDEVTIYIFVIDGNWKSGRFQVLEDNFRNIAREIGADARRSWKRV